MNEKEIARQKNFLHGRKPRILYLDLEISPLLTWTYSAYEANAVSINKLQQIVSYAWQWEGDTKIHVRALDDYPGYQAGIPKLNDKKLVHELYELLQEVDIIIGHNIQDFDLKQARARFIYHELPPTFKFKTEDTLKIARRYFKFPKNNLDALCEQLGIGTKSKVKHSDVIFDCIEGDKEAWKAMKKYNKQDIVLTRALYKKLAPWHETHNNLNFFLRRPNACPNCLSERPARFIGYKYTASQIKMQWRCKDCGKYWTGDKVDEDYEKVKQSNQ